MPSTMPSSHGTDARLLTVEDVMRLPSPPPDHRFSYGPDPNQFGELRLPKTRGPHPVAIVIHGGCWRAEYDLNHVSSFSTALAEGGIATWTFDYRRVGQSGGGWPGTFDDVARGAACLRARARRFNLDLDRVVAIGHSAGGQLAVWLASHGRTTKPSALTALNPLPIRGLIILAGITDLLRSAKAGICGEALTKLMGGGPENFPDRYRSVSPIELLPLGIEEHLLHGALDSIVPVGLSEAFVAAARKKGDKAQLTVLPQAGHYELIAPQTSAFQEVIARVRLLLGE